jgi:type IV pilus assembly protein PilW
MTRTLPARTQAGLSLVELMIAITIGLLITAGLVTVFASSSQTQNELRRTAQQIENGRYAMDILIQDLQVAGFYGSYRKLATPSAVPSNPCTTTSSTLQSDISVPVQGYASASSTAQATLPSGCTTSLIPSADLAAGSDVLVVRRASTTPLNVVAGEVATSGAYYLQVNPSTFELQTGAGAATTCTSKADGVTAATITRRCQYPNSTDTCSATCPTEPGGYIRQLKVHVYYVSPCNVFASGQTKCNANADNGRPIPTLKRLELTASGGAATFQSIAIAEGVEFMKIAYGVDDTPSAVNADTGLIGDGSPDRYVAEPAVAELPNVVTARIDLLVRNPEPSSGYSDSKTYALGVDPGAPTNPAITLDAATSLSTNYRRHVYSTEVRLVNMSSRKEIP